ncbi:MAG TPA: CHASE3 domain-containing protein [Gemmatimonadaceae bacterium]|nr:CHASE3 domain-containing protein [Gemmatimonadaceae bacterium]
MALLRVRIHSVGAGTALLVLALFGAVAFASVSRLSTQQAAVNDANAAIAKIDELLTASSDAEREGTDYTMTGAKDALDGFSAARGRAEDAIDALRARVEDNPRERSTLDTLGPRIGERFSRLSAGITLRGRKGAAAAVEFAKADTARSTRGGILPLIQRMRDEELVLLAEKTRLMTQNGKISRAVILGGSVLAFLLAAVAFAPAGAQENRNENADGSLKLKTEV